MERPGPKPVAARVDAPDAAPSVEPALEDGYPPRPSDAAWRFVLLLWLSAFGFLATYELISMLLRVFRLR
jgi:hypothetical protein